MKIVSGEVVLDAIADFAEQMLKKIHPKSKSIPTTTRIDMSMKTL